MQHGRKVNEIASAKLNEVLSFMNKTRKIFNLDVFSRQTQKHKQKLKKNSELFRHIATEPIYGTNYITYCWFAKPS